MRPTTVVTTPAPTRVLRAAVVLAMLGALGLVTARTTSAVELIVNGGFESGAFTGWTVNDLAGGSGSFFIDDADGFTPFSGNATAGPAAGSFYAVSDQSGPGTHALSQAFVVPGSAQSVTLSFDMFVNDWSGVGPIVDPVGLDHTGPPNQHARVDILSAGSPPFDTGAGVLANFFLGVDLGFPPHAYTNYLFDITGLVGGGGTFVLRFAEVDNQFFLNQGVDNVSINFVPPPSNHFKCYKAKDLKNPAFTQIKDPGISLIDQFGSEANVGVLKPFLLCNPADKNGSGIGDPSAHLCCYKIKAQKPDPKPQVQVADQFGTLQLLVVKPQLLCQPCTKTILP